jgi:hypothetical protein
MSIIHISIRHLNELFEPLDPAPLRKRALGRSAESYLLGSVRKHRQHEPLRLLVDLPESLRANAKDVTEGIHEHFRVAHVQGERRFRRRIRTGGTTLGIGLAILVTSLVLKSLLAGFEGQLAQGLGEGLLILGWVAMWRPSEILLYEHWETHLGHTTLERLATAAVEYSFVPDAVLQS